MSFLVVMVAFVMVAATGGCAGAAGVFSETLQQHGKFSQDEPHVFGQDRRFSIGVAGKGVQIGCQRVDGVVPHQFRQGTDRSCGGPASFFGVEGQDQLHYGVLQRGTNRPIGLFLVVFVTVLAVGSGTLRKSSCWVHGVKRMLLLCL